MDAKKVLMFYFSFTYVLTGIFSLYVLVLRDLRAVMLWHSMFSRFCYRQTHKKFKLRAQTLYLPFRENFVAFNFPFPVRKWNLDRFNEKLVKTLEGNLLSISGTVSQTPIQDPKRHIKNYFNSIWIVADDFFKVKWKLN